MIISNFLTWHYVLIYIKHLQYPKKLQMGKKNFAI